MQENKLLVINKPTGMSSNAAVNKVKWLLKAKKAGHLGTLDPLGSGALVVTLNKATRLFDYLVKKKKTYRAVFQFGIETDTLDSEGLVVKSDDIKVDENQLEIIIKKFIKKHEQIPPIYSAKKIKGRKACDIARSGESVELNPKAIEIYDFKLIEKLKENCFLFEITCSEGTYIRSICRDVASELGTCGVMCAICRTRCGGLSIDDSITLEDVEKNETLNFVSVDCVLDIKNKLIFSDDEIKDVLNGKKIINKFDFNCNEKFLLYHNENLFGIALFDENNLLKIITNIY